MHKYGFVVITAAAAGILSGQGIERRAEMGRGGGPGGAEGCNVVVVVDGVAEVEVRGDHAALRDISGQPPQFRAFECSRPLPPNAPGLRFIAESGRGRQEMLRESRDGAVVVRIEDPQGGAGEYRFHIAWAGGEGERRGEGARGNDRDRDSAYGDERARFFQGEGWRRNLFQRVREDVEHVAHSTIPFTGDRARLTRTIGELNELQQKLSDGRYDERQLDEVMNALRAVVDENRMPPGDREALSDDLNRLREFREHHDDYGARFRRN